MILDLISGFLSLHPTIAVVLSCVGACRVLIKPAMSLARYITSKTPTTRDDKALEALEKSKVFATVRYILDWLTSVRLPSSKK